ncbi:HIT family protein [Loigolactobacillus binensis]|uniref:HIT family protein n=1 Tax=Loigolactobacillus binensis TaxID=2559922 RepID=A0ABW3EBI2_9LACO|nr:HIT family protein [Loigolactobacillus binensis]
MLEKDCIFCQPQNRNYLLENQTAGLLLDIHPVSPGHALIIAKQHYPTFFDLPLNVRMDMNTLLDEAKTYLDQRYHPAGYNIDINVGPVGGQKIMHCHIHLIPRYHYEDQQQTTLQKYLPLDLT